MAVVSFFFNDTAPTEIYTLSLHDALPILVRLALAADDRELARAAVTAAEADADTEPLPRWLLAARRARAGLDGGDRKSTRLDSRHRQKSHAVFCLEKKKKRSRQHLGTVLR